MIRKPTVGLAGLTLAAGAALVGLTTQTASAATTFNNFGVLAPTDDTFTTSTITVAGQPLITDLNVALNLYFTQDADETEVLLQGPTGIRVPLMSDAGPSQEPVANLSLGFDDSAPTGISTSDPLVSGIYRPTDNNGIEPESGPDTEGVGGAIFPSSNAAALSAFIGTSPNGTWTLFVGDDSSGGELSGLTGGWSLHLDPSQTCRGIPVTIIGTDGSDALIQGTSGNDVINANGGDDVVRGFGGNDLICGGDGKDKLKGGAGKDTCYGGPAKDKIKCEKAKQNGG